MHVLSLPPAFVLSQDQTLKLKPPKGFLTFEPLHIVIDFDVSKFPQGNSDHIKLMKLTTPIIDQQAKTRFSKEPICKQSVSHKPTKPPTYPFFMDIFSKSGFRVPEGPGSNRRRSVLRHPAAGERGVYADSDSVATGFLTNFYQQFYPQICPQNRLKITGSPGAARRGKRNSAPGKAPSLQG